MEIGSQSMDPPTDRGGRRAKKPRSARKFRSGIRYWMITSPCPAVMGSEMSAIASCIILRWLVIWPVSCQEVRGGDLLRVAPAPRNGPGPRRQSFLFGTNGIYNLTEIETALVISAAYNNDQKRADIWPRLSRAVGATSVRPGLRTRQPLLLFYATPVVAMPVTKRTLRDHRKSVATDPSRRFWRRQLLHCERITSSAVASSVSRNVEAERGLLPRSTPTSQLRTYSPLACLSAARR